MEGRYVPGRALFGDHGARAIIGHPSEWGRSFGRQGAEQVFEWLGKRPAFEHLDHLYKTYVDLDPIFAAVLALVCVVVVLMVLQRLPFSFNPVGGFAVVETLAEDAPPGMTAQVMVLRPDPDATRKLVHREIYNRREVVPAIAEWVKQILASEKKLLIS
jgi:hypothetical protein